MTRPGHSVPKQSCTAARGRASKSREII